MPLCAFLVKKLQALKKSKKSAKPSDDSVWNHGLSSKTSQGKSESTKESNSKPLCRQQKFCKSKSQYRNLKTSQAEVKYQMMSSKLTRQKRMNTFYMKKLKAIQKSEDFADI